MLFHESGAVGEASATGEGRVSGSENSVRLGAGSVVKIDSLGSVSWSTGSGVADGVAVSGSGSSAGLVDGSMANVDTLNSVRSGVGARVANWSDTGSG